MTHSDPSRSNANLANPLPATLDKELTIPVLSESIEVEKILEHTGTVRVRKIVHLERQPSGADGFREVVETTLKLINRPALEVQIPHEHGGVLIIPVYEERLVKQLFLREELHVTRRRETVVSDEVDLRHEEVVVERLDPATHQWVADRSHP